MLLVTRQLTLLMSSQMRVGVTHVADHIAAEQQIVGAVEFGPGGLRSRVRRRPSHTTR